MAARYVLFFAIAGLILGSAQYYVWARLVRDAALPAPYRSIATALLVALFVILVSIIPVYIATRLAGSSGLTAERPKRSTVAANLPEP